MPETLYSWTFSTQKTRGALWFAVAFSIVTALVIWGFLSKFYMMSFVILLLCWIYFFVENNSDEDVVIMITELGIKVWWAFYDYSKIWTFSLIYSWDDAVLIRLKLLKRWLHILDLKIDNSVVNELKTILPNYIQEDPTEEITLTDKMIKLLKL